MGNNIKPLFSVIIPTYNHGHLIDKCLDSLICQTYTNWEAIIINNFSVDNTIETVERYSETRFRLINFSNDGIIAASRNIGLKNAQADWVCFLDSDDWWFPNKLEIICKYINDYDVVYHGMDVFYPNGRIDKNMIHGRQVKRPIYSDLLINQNAIPTSAVTIRKEIIKEVNGFAEDKELIAVEDFDLWLRISRISEKFKHVDQHLGAYRLGEINISRNFKKQMDRLNKLYSIHINNLSKIDKGLAIATLNYSLGKLRYENKDYRVALFFFLKALFNYKMWIKILGYSTLIIIKIFNSYGNSKANS